MRHGNINIRILYCAMAANIANKRTEIASMEYRTRVKLLVN